jgi:hypothetical protein
MTGVPQDEQIIRKWVDERLRLWQADRFDSIRNFSPERPRAQQSGGKASVLSLFRPLSGLPGLRCLGTQGVAFGLICFGPLRGEKTRKIHRLHRPIFVNKTHPTA